MVQHIDILSEQPIVQLLCLVVQQQTSHIKVITMAAEDNKEVEEQLFAVLVDNRSAVVEAEEDDVQHEVHVDTPVHAVAVQVKTVHHQVSQEDHCQVASVEGGDGETWIG